MSLQAGWGDGATGESVSERRCIVIKQRQQLAEEGRAGDASHSDAIQCQAIPRGWALHTKRVRGPQADAGVMPCLGLGEAGFGTEGHMPRMPLEAHSCVSSGPARMG